MAETLKVLAQAAPGAANTTLYTVPASKAVVVSLLHIANIEAAGGVDRSVRVAVNPAGGGGLAGGGVICWDLVVSRGQVVELLRGATLQAGATIVVWGSHANVSFNLFGAEVDA